MKKTLTLALLAVPFIAYAGPSNSGAYEQFGKAMKEAKRELSSSEVEATKTKILEEVKDYLALGASRENGCYEALKKYGSSKLGYSKDQCEADTFGAESEANRESAERQLRAENDRQEEVRKMRFGAKPILTFEDAVAVHGAIEGITLASAPKIKPDGKLYYLAGTIDRADGKAASFSALANNGLANMMQKAVMGIGQGEIKYFYVRLPKAMEAKYYDMAKVGIGFDIVGKYSSNRDYTTTSGERKSMPVFDALYFEFWTSEKLK